MNDNRFFSIKNEDGIYSIVDSNDLFSAADVEKRIKIRNSGIKVSVVLRKLIIDYKALNKNPKYTGSEVLRASFVKDVIATLGDAPSLVNVNLDRALNLTQQGYVMSAQAATELTNAIKRANTVYTAKFASICHKFANSLFIEAI